MSKLELKTFILGPLFTNSYLIFDSNTKNGFIIDAPSPASEPKEFIRKERLNIQFIALTHAHFDHIGALDEFSYPFYLHEKDKPMLESSDLNGSTFFNSMMAITKKPLIYPETLKFESFSIEIIHTPGHTPGSVSLKLGNWLFSGDTIFFDSIGRTDIPGASGITLIKSIKEKILTLGNDTIIYPGHGESTTVGREKKHNPFVN